MFVPVVAAVALLTMTLVAPIHWFTRTSLLVAAVVVCVMAALKVRNSPTVSVPSLFVQHPEDNNIKRSLPGPKRQAVEVDTTQASNRTAHVSIDDNLEIQEQRHRATPSARNKELTDQLMHRHTHHLQDASLTAAARLFAELQNEGLLRDDKYM